MKTLEDIILTVPSIADRGNLLSAMVKMRQALKEHVSQTEKEDSHAAATTPQEVADWLDKHWSEGTVRAKAIRKAAKALRDQGLSDNPRV